MYTLDQSRSLSRDNDSLNPIGLFVTFKQIILYTLKLEENEIKLSVGDSGSSDQHGNSM